MSAQFDVEATHRGFRIVRLAQVRIEADGSLHHIGWKETVIYTTSDRQARQALAAATGASETISGIEVARIDGDIDDAIRQIDEVLGGVAAETIASTTHSDLLVAANVAAAIEAAHAVAGDAPAPKSCDCYVGYICPDHIAAHREAIAHWEYDPRVHAAAGGIGHDPRPDLPRCMECGSWLAEGDGEAQRRSHAMRERMRRRIHA